MGVIYHRQDDEASGDWRWGVDVYQYNSNNATKQVLIGRKEGANNFEVRYFTIPPRGFSSLDQHQHDHGVLVMQGRARVMLGEHFEEVGPGDVVYIPSMERHQFENLGDDLFSFLCIIPPKPVHLDPNAQPNAQSDKETHRA
jgi:quercetin dioxygenase-like cupin family protein